MLFSTNEIESSRFSNFENQASSLWRDCTVITVHVYIAPIYFPFSLNDEKQHIKYYTDAMSYTPYTLNTFL